MVNGNKILNLSGFTYLLLLFSFCFCFFVVGSSSLDIADTSGNAYSKRLYHLNQEKEYLKGTADTAVVNQLTQSLKEKIALRDTSGADISGQGVEIDLFDVPSVDTMKAEGWLSGILLETLAARQSELQKKHDGDEGAAFSAILEEVFHSLPQLFFLSLPFFAFFLKILYFRRPGNYYVEHFIFTIYHYAYTFCIMILFMATQWLSGRSSLAYIESGMSSVTLALVLYPFYYLFVSMKRFYKDRWGRLILRYMVLLSFLLMTMLLLFMGIAIFTFLW
jgi:hypothetical protein